VKVEILVMVVLMVDLAQMLMSTLVDLVRDNWLMNLTITQITTIDRKLVKVAVAIITTKHPCN
jgi:hypothetical protein